MSTIPHRYIPLLCTLLILLAFLFFWTFPRPTQTVSAPLQGYVAQTQGHRVTIYRAGTQSPVLVTQIDPRTLPPADQTRLQTGIPLPDQTALDGFLQDFDS